MRAIAWRVAPPSDRSRGAENETASNHGEPRPTLRRIKWLAIVAPVAFLVVSELSTTVMLGPRIGTRGAHAVALLIQVGAAIGFAGVIFLAIERLQRRQLATERRLATVEERNRLSRELHDGSAQALGLLHLKCLALAKKVRTSSDKEVEQELDRLALVAREAYGDVREAILGLRANACRGGAFVDDIAAYVEQFSRQSAICTRLELPEAPPPNLTRDVQLQAIRVLQEALTNVRKHAGVEQALVQVQTAPPGVVITIHDKGRGFEVPLVEEIGGGYGVRTMRERIELIGGDFSIESQPGTGTCVKFWLPAGRW